MGIFTIDKAVVWMFIAVLMVCFVTLMGGRKKALIPGRFQGAMEVIMGAIRQKLVIDTMGPQGLPYFPFIASLFFFVFFCNIVGILPNFHDLVFVSTSNINVTATLAIIVFGVVLVTGLKVKGPGGFAKSFAPPGVPVFLLPLIVPVEIISFFAKHFALAVRLFANMFAGHIVLFVFTFGAAALFWNGFFNTLLAPFPFLGVVGMLMFEIFVATVQAFIVAIHASLYIGDSLHEHH